MEFLKSILSQETYAKFLGEVKDKDVKIVNLKEGGYVDVDKYNTAIKDLEDTRSELTERSAELTKLKEVEGASEALKSKITELEESFAQKEKDYQEKLLSNQRESIVEKEILKSGAIDTVAVKAHLQDFLSEAEFADGEIKGLVEKLNEFKEEKKHLFNEVESSGVKHREPIKKDTLQDEVYKKMGVK